MLWLDEVSIPLSIGEMKTQALQWQAAAGSFFNLHISALKFGLVLATLVAVNDKCGHSEVSLWRSSVMCQMLKQRKDC